jgi:hypothetical protein
MGWKNVVKLKARRSLDNPGNDHDLGLWVDYELLRKHEVRPSQIVIHNPVTTTNNRYLELADLALGNIKPRRRKRRVLQSR